MPYMDILEKLFGGIKRIKLIRLFVFNPEKAFTLSEAATRIGAPLDQVRVETLAFLSSDLIKKTRFFSERAVSGKRAKKVRQKGFVLNQQFPYLKSLQALLIEVMPFTPSAFLKRLRLAGKIKLVVIAGIFLQDFDSRLDVLVVGDKLNRRIIDRAITSIESDMGRELHYAILETADFQYRLGICDKLVRDVFDYPHRKLVDSLDIQYP